MHRDTKVARGLTRAACRCTRGGDGPSQGGARRQNGRLRVLDRGVSHKSLRPHGEAGTDQGDIIMQSKQNNRMRNYW